MSLIEHGNVAGIIITRTQINKSMTRKGSLKVRKKRYVTPRTL